MTLEPDEHDVPPAGPTAERNHGLQPIGALLERHGLKPSQLVEASGEQLTHKMVARAVKGRELTANTSGKVLRALNAASGASYTERDLFTYTPRT